VHPAVDLAYHGGVTWSNTTSFHPVTSESLPIENRLIEANVSSTSPYARVRSSEACRNRDILVLSTPWTAALNRSTTEYLWPNRTYHRSPQFRMRALICESHLTMEEATISASMSLEANSVLENVLDSSGEAKRIPQSLVNLTQFQDLSLNDQWRLYVDTSRMQEDARIVKSPPPRQESESVAREQVPGFSGPGIILGTLSSWNLSGMLDDSALAEQAARVKGRFLMEIIRDSFAKPTLMQPEPAQGQISIAENRVVVMSEVGITLASLFFTSFCLLLLLMWSSRLPRRPLNLPTDPGSTVGLSILLNPRLTSMDTLRRLHSASKNSIRAGLQSKTFSTSSSTFHQETNMNPPPSGSYSFSNMCPAADYCLIALKTKKSKQRRDWRPRAIQFKTLFALGAFLATILAALLVLQAFSVRSRLSQKAFIYEADISKYGLSFSTFAPISIVPTVISIAITLWWDQLDMTFRLLQPYISMSRSPTTMSSGAGLSYRSKTWIGAAVKAARNRHWILFTVAVGSTLCQVLTVSMSALFESRSADVVTQVTLNGTLGPRQAPIISTIDVDSETNPENHAVRVLDPLYGGKYFDT
jgi:hypothetical protein